MVVASSSASIARTRRDLLPYNPFKTFATCLQSVKDVRRPLQPGESREAKPDMVYLDANGHQRYTKGVDEKLVVRQRRGAAPGKAMYIEGGRHSGFFCTVRAMLASAQRREARLSWLQHSIKGAVQEVATSRGSVAGQGQLFLFSRL